MTRDPDSVGLRHRDIIALFVPLALTSTMMSISVPVINAGLARLADPEGNLAAFGIAFALSIFLESPVFAVQQATVAWYRGAGPIRPFVLFAVALGLIMAVFEAVVVFSPAGEFLIRRLMGAPDHLVPWALEALRLGILFPPLVAFRNALQGLLIARRSAAPIAWGTAVRLTTLAVLVFTFDRPFGLSGPGFASLALVVSIVAESLYVILALRRTPERTAVVTEAQTAGATLRGRFLFLAPLAATTALSTLTGPVITAFVARSRSPETALAAYAVVQSLVWFLASPALRYASVTIALGENAEAMARLRSFLWRIVGGVCVVVMGVTVSPLAVFLLESLMGLTPELAARARLPLLFLGLQPLITGFIAFNHGILARKARTGLIGWGSSSRMVAIVGVGFLGLGWFERGEILGALLLGAAFVAELGLLVLLRRWLVDEKPSLAPA